MVLENETSAPISHIPMKMGEPIESGNYFNPSDEEIFIAQQEYEQEMLAMAQAERESSPDFMQTVSMPELYEMVYPGKPPVIDKFLYPGTYLFVGAQRSARAL